MRTYVSTIGFHETRVTRPLLRDDLDDGDRVVLLRPDAETDQDRGSDAVQHVDDMLHEIAPEARLSVERISHDSFRDAVLECSDVLLAAEGDLIVNFGGGAREIFLPLTIAVLLHADRVDRALQYTDVDQNLRTWEVPRLAVDVPPERRETLRAIDALGPEVSMPDLREHLDVSKSSVSRHVGDLEDAGLVETAMQGTAKYASITLSGELQLRRP